MRVIQTLDKGKTGLVRQNHFVSLLEYLLVFFIIIEFNTPYTYFPLIKIIVLFSPMFIVPIIILSKFGRIKIDPFVFVIVVGALLPALNVESRYLLKYASLYLILLPLLYLLLSQSISRGVSNSFFYKYANIILVEAHISLFFWIGGSVLGTIEPTLLIPNSWGEDRFIPTYYGVYFETQEAMIFSSSMGLTIRNSGIFNEAPMHNLILCMALSIEFFLKERISKYRAVIIVITILSTLSSTGYLFVLFSFLFLIIVKNGNAIRKILPLFAVLIPIVFVVVLSIFDNKKETGAKSYDNRSEDIENCIQVGLENPLLGVGLFHATAEEGFSKDKYGFASSLFASLAFGGVYLFLFYCFTLFISPIIIYRLNKNKKLLFFQLCFFFLFSLTICLYRYMTMVYVALGLALWSENVVRKK